MSKHDALVHELDALAEHTALLLVTADGEPTNIAFRVRDLEGELSWALAGHGRPWGSNELAEGIEAAKSAYAVIHDGGAE
jgi:hypothetical protein